MNNPIGKRVEWRYGGRSPQSARRVLEIMLLLFDAHFLQRGLYSSLLEIQQMCGIARHCALPVSKTHRGDRWWMIELQQAHEAEVCRQEADQAAVTFGQHRSLQGGESKSQQGRRESSSSLSPRRLSTLLGVEHFVRFLSPPIMSRHFAAFFRSAVKDASRELEEEIDVFLSYLLVNWQRLTDPHQDAMRALRHFAIWEQQV